MNIWPANKKTSKMGDSISPMPTPSKATLIAQFLELLGVIKVYSTDFANPQEGTIIIFQDEEDGKIKYKDSTGTIYLLGGSGVSIIEHTYSELTTLIDSSSLVPGQYYRITDYATAHNIIGTNQSEINVGTVEPLVVLATSTSTLHHQAYSTLYPQDIIHYDITGGNTNDTSFFVGGTPITGLKGIVYYRKDTVKNVSTYFDFRNVINRRWAINPNTWSAGSYNQYDVVTDGTNVYVSLKNGNTDILSVTASWQNIWSMSKSYISTSLLYFYIGNLEIPVNNSDYQDYLTFVDYTTAYNFELDSCNVENIGTILGNNVFGFDATPGNGNTYNNTIGQDFQSNTIGYNFKSNTIGRYFQSNTIGDYFQSNTIGYNFQYNTIGYNFQYNTIGDNFESNTIGDNFRSNTIGQDFESNTIGDNFDNNTIEYNFQYNTIGDNFDNNTIGYNFQYNTIGQDFRSNTIGQDFDNNTIGDGYQYNTIGYNFQSNTIGQDFRSNTIGDDFDNNTIGDGYESNTIGQDFDNNTIGQDFNNNTIEQDFQSNTIGYNFQSNNIGQDFQSNTIGYNFQSNTIEDNFQSNTIGDGYQYNTIEDNFQSNTIGQDFKSNTIGDDFESNTIGDNFQYNTIGDNFTTNTNIQSDFQYNKIEDNACNNIDFTSATLVYLDFTKKIERMYSVSGTVSKLWYFDADSNLPIFANITD